MSESGMRLVALLAEPRQSLTYQYDFGDGWAHRVTLEEILPPGGAGAFPPMRGRRPRLPAGR